MSKNIIIVVLVILLVVVGLLVLPPRTRTIEVPTHAREDTIMMYRDSMNLAKVKELAYRDTIRQMNDQAAIEKKAYKRDIKKALTTQSVLRDSIQPLADTIPVLKKYLASSDSVSAIKDDRISYLEADQERRINVEQDLIKSGEKKDSIQVTVERQFDALILEKNTTIKEQERQLTKDKKTIKKLLIAIPIAILIGLAL
jgi:aminopeptidase N